VRQLDAACRFVLRLLELWRDQRLQLITSHQLTFAPVTSVTGANALTGKWSIAPYGSATTHGAPRADATRPIPAGGFALRHEKRKPEILGIHR